MLIRYTIISFASTLRSEFSKRRCCNDDCIGKLLRMPRDITANRCCDKHFAQLQYCMPSNTSSQADGIAFFETTIKNTREATKRYQVTNDDVVNNSVQHVNEKKAQWRTFIQTYFNDHKKMNQRGGTSYEYIYDVYDANFDRVEVCRNAWMAVYGVQKSELRSAQELVREKKMSGTSKYDIAMEDVDMRAAFERFGMDYEYYLWNTESYARLNEVVIPSLTR